MTDAPHRPPVTPDATVPRLTWVVLALALAAGMALRLAWLNDMEWKDDERWSYRQAREAGPVGTWPRLGMQTSLKFPNPGLSVWSFIALGRVAATPTAMAGAVAFINVLSLAGFAAAARAFLPPREREPWLWGVALQAVNPFAVRISRKIWPPGLLPPFLLALWVGHLHRRTCWGAFAWGLAGALIGQVHLSGWYVATALAVGTIVSDLWGRRSGASPSRWGWWLFGTALGLTPSLPWLLALGDPLLTNPQRLAVTPWMIRVFVCLTLIVGIPVGFVLDRTLGLDAEYVDFVRGPMTGRDPTYVVLGLNYVVDALLLLAILAPIYRLTRRFTRGPREASGRPVTRFTLLWGAMGTTALLAASVDVFFPHYFYLISLFLSVGLAAVVLPWRRVLLTLVVVHALLSLAFLDYIHVHGGVRQGEYGRSYARQRR